MSFHILNRMFYRWQGGMIVARLKGLVLETGDDWALILSAQGEYKKIKTKTLLQVGEIWQEPTGYTMKYAVAAAILLVFIGTALSIIPVVAYAQVSSGIELGLNRWEWVVSARPLNDDGKKILQELNLRGKTLERAVELIVDNTVINNNSEHKEIVLNVVTREPGDEQNRQRIMEKMDTRVKQILDQNKLKYNKDIIKGNSSIEAGTSNNEVTFNKRIAPQNGERLKGEGTTDEVKWIKDQLEKQYGNTPDKDIDDDLNARTDKEQNNNKEDETQEITKGQNPEAIQGDDDKTKGKNSDKGKPEKESFKSLQQNKNNEKSDQQSKVGNSVKE